jgi:predicted transcriptional regulator
MPEIYILRKQVKKFIEKASEKELEIVYHIFEATNNNDWWDEIDDEQKKAIDKGIAQLDNGEGIPNKEVMKKYSKWLKK